jgi:hypothetical protein
LQELEGLNSQLGIFGGFEGHLKMETTSPIACVGFIPSVDDRLYGGER